MRTASVREHLEVVGGYKSARVDGDLVAGDSTALSMREREALRLLALGHTNREIGTLLHISVGTAEFHRRNIQRKLNLISRSQLVEHALTHGLLEG